MIEQDTLPVGASVRTSTYYACLSACRCLHVLAQARPMMTCIALVYGYNAGQPMAIPIYTVLPYCVMEGPSVNIGCPSSKLLLRRFRCIMFRHLLLTQADVLDFWTRWIVNGFGLGNPSPLFYGHPRVEVGRINAHPPMMNKTAQLQKHRSLSK